MKMKNETTKEHYETFAIMAKETGTSLADSNRFGSQEELIEKYKEDRYLNNIPLQYFDGMFRRPMKGRPGPRSLSENVSMYKHLLIYEVIGAEPVFACGGSPSICYEKPLADPRDRKKKVVRLGQIVIGDRKVDVFCSIKYINGKLSISGVEGPMANGNAWGSCGQIVMHLKASEFETFAPGWDKPTVEKFLSQWDKWHLNDMQAGSPAQTKHLESLPKYKGSNHYDYALEELKKAGLQPDPDFIHNGKSYSYGHAWLKVEVPEEVLEFLSGLPETDKEPAWV